MIKFKKALAYSGLCRISGLLNENQRKLEGRQVLGGSSRSKKAVELESGGDTNFNWQTWKGHQKVGKETTQFENWRTNRDNPNYNIVRIDQNTEKGRGDLIRLAVTQTPVKDHQPPLM